MYVYIYRYVCVHLKVCMYAWTVCASTEFLFPKKDLHCVKSSHHYHTTRTLFLSVPPPTGTTSVTTRCRPPHLRTSSKGLPPKAPSDLHVCTPLPSHLYLKLGPVTYHIKIKIKRVRAKVRRLKETRKEEVWLTAAVCVSQPSPAAPWPPSPAAPSARPPPPAVPVPSPASHTYHSLLADWISHC